jgi:HEAT repeat protein
MDLLGYLSAAPSGVAPVDRSWPSWYPVWALRGLLYAWDPAAEPAVVAALSLDAWRVREMAAKVCLVREIGAAGDVLAELVDDPVPRVRIAAARAVAAVGEAEYAPALRRLVEDVDPACRAAADDALRRLSERLDRDLR